MFIIPQQSPRKSTALGYRLHNFNRWMNFAHFLELHCRAKYNSILYTSVHSFSVEPDGFSDGDGKGLGGFFENIENGCRSGFSSVFGEAFGEDLLFPPKIKVSFLNRFFISPAVLVSSGCVEIFIVSSWLRTIVSTVSYTCNVYAERISNEKGETIIASIIMLFHHTTLYSCYVTALFWTTFRSNA